MTKEQINDGLRDENKRLESVVEKYVAIVSKNGEDYATLTEENKRLREKLISEQDLFDRAHKWGQESEAANRTLAEENKRLREALQELIDWQNGPPLLGPKWEPGWNNAMAQAKQALTKHT